MAGDLGLVVSLTSEIAKRFEGLSLKPYVCPAGYWTIGYGHLCPAKQRPISLAEAEEFLALDVEAALRSVIRLCPVLLTEPENKLATIVDFTFNLGAGRLAASTLLRRLRARDWDTVPVELRKWVFGGGRKLPGLVLRREAEVVFFTKATPPPL